MVVIDENEDIADIDNFYFMNQKPKNNQVNKQKIIKKPHKNQQNQFVEFEDAEMLRNNESDSEDFEEQEKSKTTNLTDLLY